MKTILFSLFFALNISLGFSQELLYDIQGNYEHAITREKIVEAQSMADIIPYYPSGWISGYISVELVATDKGNTSIAKGETQELTPQQAEMLKKAGIGTRFDINIRYLFENTTTRMMEERVLHYSTTVVPEVQATCPGGAEQLAGYIKDQTIEKIPVSAAEKLQKAVVIFTVDENGAITDAHITESSGDNSIDRVLLESVQSLPRWEPAKDGQGMEVRQEFALTVYGNAGC